MPVVVRESAVVLLHDPETLELRHIRLTDAGEVLVGELACSRAAAAWLADALGRAGALWVGTEAEAVFPPDALWVGAASDDAGEPLILLRNQREDIVTGRQDTVLGLSVAAALSLAVQLASVPAR